MAAPGTHRSISRWGCLISLTLPYQALLANQEGGPPHPPGHSCLVQNHRLILLRGFHPLMIAEWIAFQKLVEECLTWYALLPWLPAKMPVPITRRSHQPFTDHPCPSVQTHY